MMTFRKLVVAVCLMNLGLSGLAAQDKAFVDSLNGEILSATADSTKAKLLEVLGRSYNLAGRHDKALEVALQLLDLDRKVGDEEREAEQLDKIGSAYFQLMNVSKAIEYFEMAKTLREKNGDEPGLANSFSNLAIIYKETGAYAKSLEYNLSALALFRKLNNQLGVGRCYNNMGLLYQVKQNYPMAELYLDSSLQIKQSMNDSVGLAATYCNMGIVYAETEQYPKAIESLEKSLAIAEAKGLREKIMRAHENLSGTYANMELFEKAYSEHVLFAQLRDSIINQRSIEQINELQAKYDADQREKDILMLEQQNAEADSLAEKRKLYVVIAVTGFLLVLSVLLLFVVYSSNKRKQQREELARNKIELEQKVLRAQMNPHFIFNALNSIQHYILSNDTQYAYDYLARFSKLVRQVLVNSESSTISLSRELELLELYIGLEQRRFKNRFEYEIRVEKDLPVQELFIPVMLVQPFVENAIWHGIMNLEESLKGHLQIEMKMKGDVLVICVEDNGVGRAHASELKSTGEHESLGMLFTRKRLELLRTTNDKETRIELIDLHNESGNPSGTRIEIYLSDVL